jgi:phospholipid-binding lipoprotein MlaA
MIHAPAAVARLPALLVGALLLGGCATTGERDPSDPWEPMNRGTFRVNDTVDRNALRPAAQTYDDHAPGWFRAAAGNFFTNLNSPTNIVNNLLQGKFKAAGQDTLRFLMNTTLGVGGLLDPATDVDLPQHDEDFGQTLGWWGVPPGPFLMLPLLGPSTVRDAPSAFFARFLEPFYWYNAGNERWVSLGLSVLELRASLLPLDATLARAYDPYAFIRTAYLQRRLYLVFDGNIPEHLQPAPLEDPLEDELEEGLEDEAAAGPESDAPPAAAPDAPSAPAPEGQPD